MANTHVQPQRWHIARFSACAMLPSLDCISVIVYTMHVGGHPVLLEGKAEYRVYVDGGFCSTGVEEFVTSSRNAALAFAQEECRIFLLDKDQDPN